MAFTKILPAGISTTGLVTVDSLSVGDVTLTGDTDNLIINTDTVTVRPTLDLNFARDKRLDSKITFTRDSVGTYVDANGLIQTAVNNIPRFDHDPTTGESLGLLIEESRTNLIANSNSPTSATGGTRTDNSQVAPDGTTTAGQLVSNSSTGYHSVTYNVTSLPSGNKFAWSIFVKLGTSNYTKVVLYDNAQTSPGSGVSRFDLSTGTKETGTGKIVAYPNGWYRLTIYGERTFTPASCSLFVFFHNGTTVSFAGDGTSTFYYWGSQLEDNVEFETSHIPTSGSTVTRAADNAVIKGTNFSSWYNQSEGTWFGEVKKAYPTTQRLLEVGDSATNNYSVSIRPGPTDTFFARISSSASSVSHTYPAKFAVADSVTDIQGCVNGTLATLVSTGSSPTDNKLVIGGVMTGTSSCNAISHLSYYNKRLPNAQLQGLTAQ